MTRNIETYPGNGDYFTEYNPVRVGEVQIDPHTGWGERLDDGQTFWLTPTQVSILAVLSHGAQVHTLSTAERVQQLMDAKGCKRVALKCSPESIRVNVSMIRKKVGEGYLGAHRCCGYFIPSVDCEQVE
jgi:hypothetical protein